MNGREFARRNLGGPGGFVFHDQTAFNGRFGTGPERVAAGAARDWLRAGDNVLAVQAHDRRLANDARFKFLGALQTVSEHPEVLISSNDVWQYFVGQTEPSGGIADPSISRNPEFHDWIELHNRSAEAVSIEGWSLTDQADGKGRWIFPALSVPAGGYVLVLASGEDVSDPLAPFLHTHFKLDAGGEYLGLYNNSGQLATGCCLCQADRAGIFHPDQSARLLE